MNTRKFKIMLLGIITTTSIISSVFGMDEDSQHATRELKRTVERRGGPRYSQIAEMYDSDEWQAQMRTEEIHRAELEHYEEEERERKNKEARRHARHARRRAHEESAQAAELERLRVEEELKERERKEEVKDEEKPSCSICMTSFEEDKDPRQTLRCGHVFHAKCIAPSLRQDNRCPNCRQPHDANQRRIRPDNPVPNLMDFIDLDQAQGFAAAQGPVLQARRAPRWRRALRALVLCVGCCLGCCFVTPRARLARRR